MHHLGQDHGIVGQTFRYSESSQILVWLTRHHGILRTLAKGSIRRKSAQLPPLDIFIEAELTFTLSRTSHLHTLREATVITPHLALRQDYLKVCTVSYFFELITRLVEQESNILPIHDLFLQAVRHLEDHPVTPRLIERFEIRLAMELGLTEEGVPVHLVRDRLKTEDVKSRNSLLKELAKNSADRENKAASIK